MLEPAQVIQILEGNSDQQTFSAGQGIFKEGESGEYMYAILEGEVDMMIGGELVETLSAGDVFGEGALLHSDRSRYSTAVAKTSCKLAAMNERHFLFAVQETPMFALNVMRSYSDRFRRLKGRLF